MTENADPPPSGPPLGPPPPGSDKARWRAWLLDNRRAVRPAVRSAEAALLAGGAVAACAMAGADGPDTVCAYLPVGSEPGSAVMLDALVASGRRVLLPIVPARALPGSALGWGEYRGAGRLVAGRAGVRRPAGPDLGPAAIADAGLVLAPAIAVDRHGVRLGRGSGWYDRSLPLVAPGALVLAVVRDGEVLDALPREPHDVLVTGVLTPTAGPRTLPGLLD